MANEFLTFDRRRCASLKPCPIKYNHLHDDLSHVVSESLIRSSIQNSVRCRWVALVSIMLYLLFRVI